MTAQPTIVLTGVGDVSPMRDDPSPLFDRVAPIFRAADISFGQLERPLSKGRTDPKWTLCLPENPERIAPTLADAGFDVMSVAGNHHMDAGVEALLDTIAALETNGIRSVGVGMNITEARAPVIVERKGTRVAFLGYSAILPRGSVPYEATQNKPGCAPMYVATYYEQVDWQPGTPPKIITRADPDDLAAMVASVTDAKARADIVVISIHWGVRVIPSLIAMYEYEIGHAAIDAGADVIFGHHAHIVKGIEVYRGKVIFHNLGNFVHERPRLFKNHDIVGRHGGSPLMLHRFGPGLKGHYPFEDDNRKALIAKITISEGRIDRVSFLPCVTGEEGAPEPLSTGDDRHQEVCEYVKWTTREQGLETDFVADGNELVVATEGSGRHAAHVAKSWQSPQELRTWF